MDSQLRNLIELIFVTHEEGTVNCETCLESLHTLWAKVEGGADLHELLPAMAAHLECCSECAEEYGAFISIMRAETEGLTRDCIEIDMRNAHNGSSEDTPHHA